MTKELTEKDFSLIHNLVYKEIERLRKEGNQIKKVLECHKLMDKVIHKSFNADHFSPKCPKCGCLAFKLGKMNESNRPITVKQMFSGDTEAIMLGIKNGNYRGVKN